MWKHMGQRATSLEGRGRTRFAGGSNRYRPESPIKQVGYLLVLAVVCALIMFAGLGLMDVILDFAQR